jgi:hypothetical protein
VRAAISYYYEKLEANLAEDDTAEAEHDRRKAEYLSRQAR